MSAQPYPCQQLVCDHCSAVHPLLSPRIGPVRAAAAAAAAADGWTHERKRFGSSNWPRVVDTCPRCKEKK